jgi:hypothetical protein
VCATWYLVSGASVVCISIRCVIYRVLTMLDMVLGAQYLCAGHGISNRYVVSGT